MKTTDGALEVELGDMAKVVELEDKRFKLFTMECCDSCIWGRQGCRRCVKVVKVLRARRASC